MLLQNLIIKDQNKTPFRICKFTLTTDKYNEDYIKFIFPELNKKPARFEDHSSNKVEVIESITEYSFHFISGVSHFKTSNNRIKRNESAGKFTNSKLLHIITFEIYDLLHFKPYSKNDPLDYTVKKKFESNKGKIFEFYLEPHSDKAILPTTINNSESLENIELINLHPFSKENKYTLVIVEYEFKNLNSANKGVLLYRKYNQSQDYFETPK
jgi:hypothetical protein